MMGCSDALVLSITAAAIAVSKELTKDEMTLLSSAAMQFGDTLATLAALRPDCPPDPAKTPDQHN